MTLIHVLMNYAVFGNSIMRRLLRSFPQKNRLARGKTPVHNVNDDSLWLKSERPPLSEIRFRAPNPLVFHNAFLGLCSHFQILDEVVTKPRLSSVHTVYPWLNLSPLARSGATNYPVVLQRHADLNGRAFVLNGSA